MSPCPVYGGAHSAPPLLAIVPVMVVSFWIADGSIFLMYLSSTGSWHLAVLLPPPLLLVLLKRRLDIRPRQRYGSPMTRMPRTLHCVVGFGRSSESSYVASLTGMPWELSANVLCWR